MHMADALISPAVGGAMWAASAGVMAYSMKKTDEDDSIKRKIALSGVMGAFVFAAQMVNFSIPGTGSSGHICGALLLSAILGKYMGFLTLSVILCIQALFFADGGLLALGCNIFNIGVLNCLVAYPLVFKPLMGKDVTKKSLLAASLIASIIGLQISSLSVVLETLVSGRTELPFGAFLLLMQPIHLAISICEGLITAALLIFLNTHAPETITDISGNTRSIKPAATILIIISALAVGGIVSVFSSGYPDGLEWSIENTLAGRKISEGGEIHGAAEEIQQKMSFMPDYNFQALTIGENNSKGIAGVTGSVITLASVLLLCMLLADKKRRQASRQRSGDV